MLFHNNFCVIDTYILQAITRKWNSLHLNREENLKDFLNFLWAIPLLPPEHFDEAIRVIRQLVDAAVGNEVVGVNLFFNYWRRYWLPQREIVSVWRAPVRTNNIAEGFNRHIITRLGGIRPPFFRFLGLQILTDISE